MSDLSDDERDTEGYPMGLPLTSVTGGHSNAHARIDGSTILVPHMLWVALLSGLALAVSLFCCIVLLMIWKDVRLLQLHQADMKTAMVLHGINPHPHMDGESP